MQEQNITNNDLTIAEVKDCYCMNFKLLRKGNLNILEQIKHILKETFFVCQNEALNKIKSKQKIC